MLGRWGLYTCMYTVMGFVALGMLLGAFLSFPAFASMAIACSAVYSFYSFDGTMIGYIASLLIAIVGLQVGYFIAIFVIVLRRRVQLARRGGR
jgi:hypothetical protein